MKHFVVCLALALICGVVLSNNTTNTTDPRLCAEAKTNITKAEKAIVAQKSRLYPDAKEIANLEDSIIMYRRLANQTCAPAEICSDAKAGIIKSRKAIDAEKSRLYPDAKVIQKYISEIAFYNEQINAQCSGDELCSNGQAEIKLARKKIEAEKSRLYPDAKVIASLEEEINTFKRVVFWRCPANETCALAQADFKSALNAIAAEKNRLYPNKDVIAKLEVEASNTSEVIFNKCATNVTCAFLDTEVQRVQTAIKSEQGRLYPDRAVIAKNEAYVLRLKGIQSDRCSNNSGFMRLAEVAVRSGRFLAKMLRH